MRPYAAKSGKILKICNHFIPYTNSVWKQTALVSRRFVIYFVKVILISTSVHGYTKCWWFFFKVNRGNVISNLMDLKNAYRPTTVR